MLITSAGDGRYEENCATFQSRSRQQVATMHDAPFINAYGLHFPSWRMHLAIWPTTSHSLIVMCVGQSAGRGGHYNVLDSSL